jgi:hypothetical protein
VVIWLPPKATLRIPSGEKVEKSEGTSPASIDERDAKETSTYIRDKE